MFHLYNLIIETHYLQYCVNFTCNGVIYLQFSVNFFLTRHLKLDLFMQRTKRIVFNLNAFRWSEENFHNACKPKAKMKICAVIVKQKKKKKTEKEQLYIHT